MAPIISDSFEPGAADRWAYPLGAHDSFSNLLRFMQGRFYREFVELPGILANLPSDLSAESLFLLLSHPLWIFHVRHARSQGNVFPLQELLSAIAIVLGEDTEMNVPASDYRFFSLPGTGLSLDLHHLGMGSKEFRLKVGSGMLLVESAGQEIARLHVQRQARTSDEAIHWLPALNDWLEIDSRDIRFLRYWMRTAPENHAQLPAWSRSLAENLELIRQYSFDLQAELKLLLRTIVPVQAPSPGALLSCSSRDFWGAIQCCPHPGIILAEALIHESRHILLNALMEAVAIFEQPLPGPSIYYSPWRKDSRPLSGILHAIFSFLEVTAFYRYYISTTEQPKPQARYAEATFIENAYRLRIAADVLDRNANWTAFGVAFFGALTERIEDLWQSESVQNLELRRGLFKKVEDHLAAFGKQSRPTSTVRNRNYLPGLHDFVQRWGTKTPQITNMVEMNQSHLGNINLTGSSSCYSAKTFAPSDPEFAASLEEGIRELVFLLMAELRCITYSSCQGHPAAEGVPLRERHVGILPRTDEEYRKLENLLKTAANASNAQCSKASVEARIVRGTLFSDQLKMPCLDVLFASTATSDNSYFNDVESAYNHFLTALRSQANQ